MKEEKIILVSRLCHDYQLSDDGPEYVNSHLIPFTQLVNIKTAFRFSRPQGCTTFRTALRLKEYHADGHQTQADQIQERQGMNAADSLVHPRRHR